MAQKGDDDEGILGFLADDIQKEIRRGKRLVSFLENFYLIVNWILN